MPIFVHLLKQMKIFFFDEILALSHPIDCFYDPSESVANQGCKTECYQKNRKKVF